jgi:hypothetical protein
MLLLDFDTLLSYDIFGNGIKKVPFVIRPPSLSDSLFCIEVSDSNEYINFTNQKLYRLSFLNCHNISIYDSELKFLEILKCQDINLNNIEVKKHDYIRKSENINLHAIKCKELHVERYIKT